MRLHRTPTLTLATTLWLVAAACAPSGGPAVTSESGGGKADDGSSCEGAALDEAGVCRIAGRFADASCCEGDAPASCSDTPASDPLQIAAERLNTRWGDWNIASSSIRIGADDLEGPVTDEQLKAANEELLRTQFAENEYEPLPDVALDTVITDELYEDLAAAAAERVSDEGFVYAPENHEDRCRVLWGLENVLDWLDEDREFTSVVETTTNVGDDIGERHNVTVTTFFNRETNRFVYVYVREGAF